jgi:acyl-CoA reductase-like NAD-dependent aldehyde dehydrogenase
MLDTATAVKVRSLIAGEWVDGRDAALTVRDPATSEGAFLVEAATASDAEAAVAAAHDAQRGWAKTAARRRGEILFEAADELERGREELALRLTREMGKVLAESRAEVSEAIFFLRFMAGEGARLAGETRPSVHPERLAVAERAPAGVVAVITPWNFPLCIPAWKIATALVAGNSVVFKPALQTSGTGAALAEALCAAGLPEGVLNLVAGRGQIAGEALARHPEVRVLAFTGSTAVGRRLAGLVAGRGGRAALELGGKNVAVVLEDADLEQAAREIGLGAFATTGQRCTATSRVVVDAAVHGDFAALVAERADALAVGRGTDPASDVGPLVSVESRDRVAAAVEQAVADGGRLAAGGYVPPDLPSCAGFYRPTVLTELSPTHPIVGRELFGPVTAVLRARDQEEALALANATEYGLAASVFTRDLDRALAFARGLEAGMVFVNAATVDAETQLPFGGIKASGNGSRDTGLAALDSYTEWRSIYLASLEEPSHPPSSRS